jgi:hypothetical protein
MRWLMIFCMMVNIFMPSKIGAQEDARAVPSLFDFVIVWLSENYDMPVPRTEPEIIAMPHKNLFERRYGRPPDEIAPQVEALYDAVEGRILVSDNWSGSSIADLSILVHELVHHLQAQSGWIHACPAEREKLAYQAQDDFLKMFGQSLENTFGIDPALILVATSCIH